MERNESDPWERIDNKSKDGKGYLGGTMAWWGLQRNKTVLFLSQLKMITITKDFPLSFTREYFPPTFLLYSNNGKLYFLKFYTNHHLSRKWGLHFIYR